LEWFAGPLGILGILVWRSLDLDGSMILFEDVIQVLHGSVPTTRAQRPVLLTVGDRGAVDRCQKPLNQ
ncbi:MAG: hypothetical protein WBW03_08810, partial [Silvibacterium sp.]